MQTDGLTGGAQSIAIPAQPAAFQVMSTTLRIRTERGPQFVDITDEVQAAIDKGRIENGFALVFSRHTTAAIRLNEAEPHLIADMEQMLENVVPISEDYAHNRHAHAVSVNGDRPNGHSHCRHLLLGASEAVPIAAGRLTLGQWQRLFLVELDHGRDREVIINLVGA